MIGCAEFCGTYDWTFEYLRRTHGEDAVRAYWEQAISVDSQRHARELIVGRGIAGMIEYWAHTLEEEEAGYTCSHTAAVYRIDMFACPSQGFLQRRGIEFYHDYCDHCMGWIKPLMDEAGFVIHHDHNHEGQCWWEMRPVDDDPGPSAPGGFAGEKDVRLRPGYPLGRHHTWRAGQGGQ
jgi:hypothetical protein